MHQVAFFLEPQPWSNHTSLVPSIYLCLSPNHGPIITAWALLYISVYIGQKAKARITPKARIKGKLFLSPCSQGNPGACSACSCFCDADPPSSFLQYLGMIWIQNRLMRCSHSPNLRPLPPPCWIKMLLLFHRNPRIKHKTKTFKTAPRYSLAPFSLICFTVRSMS